MSDDKKKFNSSVGFADMVFNKVVKKDPELEKSLLALKYLSDVKKQIRKIYGKDNPEYIHTLIGKKINNNVVDITTYENSLIIDKEYKKYYIECREKFNNIKNKPATTG